MSEAHHPSADEAFSSGLECVLDGIAATVRGAGAQRVARRRGRVR